MKSPYDSMSNMYPFYQNRVPVHQTTVPEVAEQEVLGEVRTAASGNRVFGRVDFFRLLGFLAVVGLIMVAVGMAGE